MYLHFFNFGRHNPGAVVIGPCFLNISRGILRVSPHGDEEGAEIRTSDGSYIVNGKTFSDIETLESLEFAPADCKILTPDEFGEQEEAIRSFVCHGTYAYSNACGYEVELSPDGESARLRINGHEPTATVTDWLPIRTIENEAGEEGNMFYNVIDPKNCNIPLDLVMRIN